MSEHKRVYLILGDGRMASHLKAYLGLCGVATRQWARRSGDIASLQKAIASSTHILFAVSDSAISELAEATASARVDKFGAHFSGALSVTGLLGIHPLMTFAASPYSLEEYRAIPLVTDADITAAREFFPFFTNPIFKISPEAKARYHALCVASGNFTNLLWRSAMQGFGELGLPPEILKPYMVRTLENLVQDPQGSLTGPLARKDLATIEKNLEALRGTPLYDVYKAFLGVAGIKLQLTSE